MHAPPFFAQQPRWLLLSVFLFLWSLASGLRGDGRSRALGLGVDARAHKSVADHIVVVDIPSEALPDGIWKRQVGIPNCAALCASQASDEVGCGDSLNLGCACHSPTFLPDTVNCMDKNCTSIDEQLGEQALQSACKAIGSATTSAASSTTFSVSSTSISSGPVPICTTVSPTSGSVTTTVSVTVTVTSSPPASSGSSSGAASNTPSPSASPSASPSPSASSNSAPVVTTTTSMLTSSSTVLVPTAGSMTQPITTVTSTSTLGSGPSSGTVGDLNPTSTGVGAGQTGGAVDERGGVGVAVVAAILGMTMLWMV